MKYLIYASWELAPIMSDLLQQYTEFEHCKQGLAGVDTIFLSASNKKLLLKYIKEEKINSIKNIVVIYYRHGRRQESESFANLLKRDKRVKAKIWILGFDQSKVQIDCLLNEVLKSMAQVQVPIL